MRTAILGGHVIDPANRVDGKLNLVMENGKIVWAGREKPDADRIIDASGLVVTPGFIDIHMHEDPVSGGKIRQSIFHMALSMGVTTDLGGNCGINVYDPAAYLDLVDRDGAAVNVAMMAGHEYFRKKAGAEDIYAKASDTQLDAMQAGIEKALRAGCAGVSFGLRYVPGADKREFFRAAQCCSKDKKLISSHVRDDADGIFTAIAEFCEAGLQYRLPVQISHIGSMGGFGQMAEVLRQVDEYRLGGLDIAMDCYPYFAFSTRIGTPTYDPGWLDRYHCDYGVLEFCEGKYKGQRATKETFDEVRRTDPQCITVCYVMRQEDIRLAFRHPNVMLASDGLMDNGQGHPRAAGTFPRFLAEFAGKDLTLYEAVRKMTALPAARLGLSNKGRLNVGADADITIFDPARVKDRATFPEPTLPPEGIEYVFLGGEPALEHGKLLRDDLGRSARV